VRRRVVVGLGLALGLALAPACAGDGTAGGTAGDDDATPTADGAPSGGAVDAAPPGTPDAAPQEFPCAPEAVAGHQEAIVCPEGVLFDVEASVDCVAGGCGLVLDVHGYTMSADQLDTHTRMRQLAPPLGYVVVQPSAPGIPPTWGVGEHDDVVWQFVEATMQTFAIDPDRVHVMGFSQGSMMTFRLLCAHADAIASVAPDSGGGCFDGGEPAVERAILYVQGHTDNILPWSIHGPPQRDAIVAAWSMGDEAVFASGTKYTATRWQSAAGTVFEFWEHDYSADPYLGGHCLATPLGAGLFSCDGAEFDYGAEALRFFLAHPRGQ
jgi:pimeloyl-ACP methyl ester carboxylesterase